MTMDTTTTIMAAFLPIVLWLYTSYMSSNSFPTLQGKRIVLLTAHPDDEAMFFAPTVQALTNPDHGNHVKILCLSSGNADGLGERRKVEIVRSAQVLGVKGEDVLVLEDTQLQDSFTSWPAAHIASILLSTFAPRWASTPASTAPTANIDAVITFDAYGVSSHPNHISCYQGAVSFLNQLMSKHTGWDCPVSVYVLRTVSIARKYVGFGDAAISVVRAILGMLMRKDKERRGMEWFSGSGRDSQRKEGKSGTERESPSWLLYVSGVPAWIRGMKAMVSCHKSQMVWFRWGWIAIGRYMVVNDLRRLKHG